LSLFFRQFLEKLLEEIANSSVCFSKGFRMKKEKFFVIGYQSVNKLPNRFQKVQKESWSRISEHKES